MLESKPLMRSVLLALALMIALAPAFEALAGGPLHSGCDSAPSQTAGAEASHAAHHAADDASVQSSETHNQCDCGCDCGPVHGCTAASTAAPATTTGTMLPAAGMFGPAVRFQPFSSRFATPLYRPPIPQLTI